MPSPATKCLTLIASAGDLPAWNSRHTSACHRAIPLTSPEMLARFPMISELIDQLGVRPEEVAGPSPQLAEEPTRKGYNVFYVEEAAGSPSVPAQLDFVQPFGVRSVLGFGGVLPGGDLFAVVLFARVPVPKETPNLFKPLALNVTLAALPFHGSGTAGPVFAPGDDLVRAG
jgi:two-component system NtrC family sensor kinase